MVHNILPGVFLLFYLHFAISFKTRDGNTDVPFMDTTTPNGIDCTTCEDVCLNGGMTYIGPIEECYIYGYCPCAFADTCYMVFSYEYCEDYYDYYFPTTSRSTDVTNFLSENCTQEETNRNSKLIRIKRILRRRNIRKGDDSEDSKKYKHHHKSKKHHQKSHKRHHQSN